jgi:hypothetical protein
MSWVEVVSFSMRTSRDRGSRDRAQTGREVVLKANEEMLDLARSAKTGGVGRIRRRRMPTMASSIVFWKDEQSAIIIIL